MGIFLHRWKGQTFGENGQTGGVIYAICHIGTSKELKLVPMCVSYCEPVIDEWGELCGNADPIKLHIKASSVDDDFDISCEFDAFPGECSACDKHHVVKYFSDIRDALYYLSESGYNMKFTKEDT